MTPVQIDKVVTSWDFVLRNTKEVGMIFYDKLFELDPELRTLFKGDIKPQAQKLISMITFAVQKLNNPGELTSDVKALGIRHKKYVVKPGHYTTVGAALIYTLEKGMGDLWDQETMLAWLEVYAKLSGIMVTAGTDEKEVVV